MPAEPYTPPELEDECVCEAEPVLGSGWGGGDESAPCILCAGTGQTSSQGMGNFEYPRECVVCGGTGVATYRLEGIVCNRCDGSVYFLFLCCPVCGCEMDDMSPSHAPEITPYNINSIVAKGPMPCRWFCPDCDQEYP